MEQENKQLLLKDLSARLPYGVKMWFQSAAAPIMLDEFILSVVRNRDENCKPYLRPMSSMTEEEAIEYVNCGNIIVDSPQKNYLIPNPNCIDWLNAHHFDYRGLIEKGLALEALEGMYKFE